MIDTDAPRLTKRPRCPACQVEHDPGSRQCGCRLLMTGLCGRRWPHPPHSRSWSPYGCPGRTEPYEPDEPDERSAGCPCCQGVPA